MQIRNPGIFNKFFSVLNMAETSMQIKKDKKGVRFVEISGSGRVLISCKINAGGYENIDEFKEEELIYDTSESFIYSTISHFPPIIS